MTAETNAYEAPETELVNDDDDSYGEIRWLDASIRVGRLRYLAHAFIFSLVLLPFAALMAVSQTLGIIAMGIAYIFVIVATCIVAIQRLHDINVSGWWLLLMLVPLVNAIFGLVLLFYPGTKGANRFGRRPPPNQWWHWVVGLIAPILFVVGVLAAVAIPAYHDYTERARAAQMDLG